MQYETWVCFGQMIICTSDISMSPPPVLGLFFFLIAIIYLVLSFLVSPVSYYWGADELKTTAHF